MLCLHNEYYTCGLDADLELGEEPTLAWRRSIPPPKPKAPRCPRTPFAFIGESFAIQIYIDFRLILGVCAPRRQSYSSPTLAGLKTTGRSKNDGT